MLPTIPKKSYNILFKQFSKLKNYKKKSEKSFSKLSFLTSIMIYFIWSAITSVNYAKTILLLLKPFSLTKFFL